MSPALIAIDWGSSSFRGYLMSRGRRGSRGDSLGRWDRKRSGRGISGDAPAPRRALARRQPGSPGDRLGHGRQPAWLARGALSRLPRRTARRGGASDGGRGQRTARRPRAGPVMRGRGGRGCDAGGGDGNLRHRRRRSAAHRAAGLAFEMGKGRRRAHCRVQDLHHRRAVRRAARPHGRRRLRQGRAGERARTGVRARPSSAAPRRPAARRSSACSASCSAPARCRSWASSIPTMPANIFRAC